MNATRTVIAGIAAGVALVATWAPAATLRFTVTGSDGPYAFSLPDSATVSSQDYGAQFFQHQGVLEGVKNFGVVAFESDGLYFGGTSLAADRNQYGNAWFDFTGAGPYGASTPDPTAVPTGGALIFDVPRVGSSAVYNLIPISGGAGVNDVLTITAAPSLPEPTAWALMLVGLGGLGVSLRESQRSGTAPD
jgi:hypothetical protein